MNTYFMIRFVRLQNAFKQTRLWCALMDQARMKYVKGLEGRKDPLWGFNPPHLCIFQLKTKKSPRTFRRRGGTTGTGSTDIELELEHALFCTIIDMYFVNNNSYKYCFSIWRFVISCLLRWLILDCILRCPNKCAVLKSDINSSTWTAEYWWTLTC